MRLNKSQIVLQYTKMPDFNIWVYMKPDFRYKR